LWGKRERGKALENVHHSYRQNLIKVERERERERERENIENVIWRESA
jgi:hypothetical protein